jgi:hypothetical protein
MNSLSDIDQITEAFALLVNTTGPALEYRIHYDSTGHITGCSANGFAETTTYLVVDKETYDNYSLYESVTDGKLVKKPLQRAYQQQLVPSNTGWRVVRNNANIVLYENEENTEVEFYAYRNN